MGRGMNEAERQRYSRQIRLAQIGEAGQQSLLDSRVLIIGMGGLGSPVALYLAAAGVGTLVLSDFDRVEDSNLQRQIIHRSSDIGELKTDSAANTIKTLNPACNVIPIGWELDDAELREAVEQADLVVDCCDNFATRFAVNRMCVASETPLVSGAAIRMEGQIATYLPDTGPCYQCLYPSELEHEESCAMEGVLAPLVGVIGSLQAMQAIQVLTGRGEELAGKLTLFDAAAMEWRSVRVPQNPQCPVCGK